MTEQALQGEILVRADGAGATHKLTQYCRDAGMRFSFGFDLDDRVRTAIAGLPEAAWIKAIRADKTERKHSQVAEITDRIDLCTWVASLVVAVKHRLGWWALYAGRISGSCSGVCGAGQRRPAALIGRSGPLRGRCRMGGGGAHAAVLLGSGF